MKKLVLMFTVAIVAATLHTANAQVSLNINIGLQPNWGPRGYDYVEYYYLPEIATYYHVPTRRYVYYNGGAWVHRTSLPRAYRGYNLYKGRKIVINQPRPYLNHRSYQSRYVDKYRHDNGRHKGWNKKDKHHGRGGRH
jgi:hypothetical protein